MWSEEFKILRDKFEFLHPNPNLHKQEKKNRKLTNKKRSEKYEITNPEAFQFKKTHETRPNFPRKIKFGKNMKKKEKTGEA